MYSMTDFKKFDKLRHRYFYLVTNVRPIMGLKLIIANVESVFCANLDPFSGLILTTASGEIFFVSI